MSAARAPDPLSPAPSPETRELIMDGFKSIVVDIDATAPVQPALRRAVYLARTCGARLTIVDVLSVPSYARRYLSPGLEEELLVRRREDLARIAGGVEEVPADAKLLSGRPATALIEEVVSDYVVAEGVDLVVMGTVARRGIAGLLIGNTAERVLRRLPCSVLAVKPEEFAGPGA
ncbi:MAG: universal stress protein [Gemmatimonadetes bacterium]|nr:universal stress protein [Gemmatimonadota bacterium]